MADISSFKPNGTGGASYNFKDATARSNISTLSNTVNNLGTRVTALENAGGGFKLYYGADIEIEDAVDYDYTDCDYVVTCRRQMWNNESGSWVKEDYWTIANYRKDQSGEDVLLRSPATGDILIYNNARLLRNTPVYSGQNNTGSIVGYTYSYRDITEFYYIIGVVEVNIESEDYPKHYNTFTRLKLCKLDYA